MLKKILLFLIFIKMTAFSYDYTSLVRYSSFYNYPNITVDEIINSIFNNVIWETIIGADGNDYVNMTSEGFILQFRIVDNNRWYINAAELNGKPYSIKNIADELYNLYIERNNTYKKEYNNDSYFINLVKNNYFSSYRDVKVGDMMNGIFSDVKWDKIVGVDGNNYVNMTAYSQNEKVILQFRIIDNYSWNINALEIDGIAYSIDNIDDKLYTLYQNNNLHYNSEKYYDNHSNDKYNLSYNINIVRDNYFSNYKDVTIGDIIDTIFSKLGYDVKWKDLENEKVSVEILSANNKWKSVLIFKIANNNAVLIDASINGSKYDLETIKNDLHNSYLETIKQYGKFIKE